MSHTFWAEKLAIELPQVRRPVAVVGQELGLSRRSGEQISPSGRRVSGAMLCLVGSVCGQRI